VIESVLLDTGPLVAFCNARDVFHEWACEQFRLVRPPFATCEPVITETCFLLGDRRDAVLNMVTGGVIRIALSLDDELDSVQRLMNKYADVPMSLADACLVRMCELQPSSAIMTLDSDFRFYRRNGRRIIPLIAPLRQFPCPLSSLLASSVRGAEQQTTCHPERSAAESRDLEY